MFLLPLLPRANSNGQPWTGIEPPTLILSNASNSIFIRTQINSPSFRQWLHLTISRKESPVVHVTRPVVGNDLIEWSKLPDDAISCFRVSALGNGSAPRAFSKNTCYFGCSQVALAWIVAEKLLTLIDAYGRGQQGPSIAPIASW